MPPHPPNIRLGDAARREALAQSGLTPGAPSPGDGALDRLASLAGKILHVPVAMVTLVEEGRQVFQGLSGILPEPYHSHRESPLDYSLCQHVVSTGRPLIVNDAPNDERVAANLAVTKVGVAAYLGVPLTTPDGHVLGSLCALDMVPRQWTEEEVETLAGLASFANTELELRRTSHQMAAAAGHDRERAAAGADGTHLLVHDLRTPLNSMLLGLQTVPLLGDLNAEQTEALEMAARSGQALMSLVNDMLDLSAAEAAGKGITLHLAPLLPPEMLDRAMRQVTSLARERQIQLTAEALEPLPPTFEGDADKLVRVLVNLLGNAIKFTPAGGKVTASVGPDLATGDLTFCVSDTGRGIAPADHARIFDRFVRVGRNAEGGGGRSSGLGLAFCKMVAEAHGGAITVESELGRGSRFCLRVPCRAGALGLPGGAKSS